MKTPVSILILLSFLLNSLGPLPQAVAEELNLPKPGVMVHLSPEFTPSYLSGLVIHPENVLKFDFLIHQGDKSLDEANKKEEYQNLIKYFLAAMTIPDQDQWVNLSPYEKDRIIKDDFGKTQMGRDLLVQDYLLKQITSSLIYPEEGLGKKFWERIYQKVQVEYGTSEVSVNTFNKVWIVPDEAVVYESGNTVYVLRNHLKVMLEEDYLSLLRNTKNQQRAPSSSLASKIIKEIILPEIEKEVNEGKNFANLRQIYSGMILSTWYKRTLKDSLLTKVYANQVKLKGVYSKDPQAKQKIYQQYLKAFKKGVFNYIKDDVDQYTRQPISRKYFSGGTKGYDEARIAVIHPGENTTSFSLDMASIARKTDKATVILSEGNEFANQGGLSRRLSYPNEKSSQKISEKQINQWRLKASQLKPQQITVKSETIRARFLVDSKISNYRDSVVFFDQEGDLIVVTSWDVFNSVFVPGRIPESIFYIKRKIAWEKKLTAQWKDELDVSAQKFIAEESHHLALADEIIQFWQGDEKLTPLHEDNLGYATTGTDKDYFDNLELFLNDSRSYKMIQFYMDDGALKKIQRYRDVLAYRLQGQEYQRDLRRAEVKARVEARRQAIAVEFQEVLKTLTKSDVKPLAVEPIPVVSTKVEEVPAEVISTKPVVEPIPVVIPKSVLAVTKLPMEVPKILTKPDVKPVVVAPIPVVSTQVEGVPAETRKESRLPPVSSFVLGLVGAVVAIAGGWVILNLEAPKNPKEGSLGDVQTQKDVPDDTYVYTYATPGSKGNPSRVSSNPKDRSLDFTTARSSQSSYRPKGDGESFRRREAMGSIGGGNPILFQFVSGTKENLSSGDVFLTDVYDTYDGQNLISSGNIHLDASVPVANQVPLRVKIKVPTLAKGGKVGLPFKSNYIIKNVRVGSEGEGHLVLGSDGFHLEAREDTQTSSFVEYDLFKVQEGVHALSLESSSSTQLEKELNVLRIHPGLQGIRELLDTIPYGDVAKARTVLTEIIKKYYVYNEFMNQRAQTSMVLLGDILQRDALMRTKCDLISNDIKIFLAFRGISSAVALGDIYDGGNAIFDTKIGHAINLIGSTGEAFDGTQNIQRDTRAEEAFDPNYRKKLKEQGQEVEQLSIQRNFDALTDIIENSTYLDSVRIKAFVVLVENKANQALARLANNPRNYVDVMEGLAKALTQAEIKGITRSSIGSNALDFIEKNSQNLDLFLNIFENPQLSINIKIQALGHISTAFKTVIQDQNSDVLKQRLRLSLERFIQAPVDLAVEKDTGSILEFKFKVLSTYRDLLLDNQILAQVLKKQLHSLLEKAVKGEIKISSGLILQAVEFFIYREKNGRFVDSYDSLLVKVVQMNLKAKDISKSEYSTYASIVSHLNFRMYLQALNLESWQEGNDFKLFLHELIPQFEELMKGVIGLHDQGGKDALAWEGFSALCKLAQAGDLEAREAIKRLMDYHKEKAKSEEEIKETGNEKGKEKAFMYEDVIKISGLELLFVVPEYIIIEEMMSIKGQGALHRFDNNKDRRRELELLSSQRKRVENLIKENNLNGLADVIEGEEYVDELKAQAFIALVDRRADEQFFRLANNPLNHSKRIVGLSDALRQLNLITYKDSVGEFAQSLIQRIPANADHLFNILSNQKISYSVRSDALHNLYYGIISKNPNIYEQKEAEGFKQRIRGAIDEIMAFQIITKEEKDIEGWFWFKLWALRIHDKLFAENSTLVRDFQKQLQPYLDQEGRGGFQFSVLLMERVVDYFNNLSRNDNDVLPDFYQSLLRNIQYELNSKDKKVDLHRHVDILYQLRFKLYLFSDHIEMFRNIEFAQHFLHDLIPILEERTGQAMDLFGEDLNGRMALESFWSLKELSKRKDLQAQEAIARLKAKFQGQGENGKNILDQMQKILDEKSYTFERPKKENPSKPKQISPTSKIDKAMKGGIDFNSENLKLKIKRDGVGVPLPIALQDMASLSRIQGFIPVIIKIESAANLPVFAELQG